MQQPSQIAVYRAKKLTVIAVAGALLLPLVTATNATPPTVVGDVDLGDAWRGPWNPSVTDAEAQRFVALWAPRVLDNGWFNAYVREEGYAPDLVAEGFHGLDIHTKMFLVDRLFDHFLATELPFRAEIDALPLDVRTPRLDEMKTMMTMFIFQKESWQQAIAEMRAPDADVPEVAPMEDDGALEAAIAPLREVAPLSVETAVVPDELRAPDPVVVATQALFGEHRARGDLLWTGVVTPEAAAPNVDAASSDPVVAGPISMQPRVVPSDPSDLLMLARDVVDATTYRVCGVGASGTESCSSDMPLGSVVPVDLNGDLVPDATGRLGAGADPAFPLGITLEFEVRSLAALTGPPQGRVTAVFEVPTVLKRVVVGFDGRETALAPTSTLRFTVKDPAAALADDVQARMSILHDAALAPNTVVFAVKDLEPTALLGIAPGLGDGVETNPISGAFRFDPVPASFVVDAGLTRSASESRYSFDTRTTPTRVDATIVQLNTATNGEQRFYATVDELPETLHIDFVQPEGAVGAASASYSASAPIGLFQLMNVQLPDRSDPTRGTVLEAQVTDIPTQVSFQLQSPFGVVYSANGLVGEARVSMSTFDGALKSRITGVATDVPESVTLDSTRSGDTTTLVYAASSSMTSLAATLYDRESDELNAVATVTGIPTAFTLSYAPPAVSFTAADPIGMIDVKLSQNAGGHYTFVQDHATFRQAGDARGASLQLSGLQSFSADPTDGGLYSLTLNPGGQRFTAYADFDGQQLAYLDVSNLPQTIGIDLRPSSSSFSYDAGAVVSSVTAWYQDATTGLFAALDLAGLPASVDVSWAMGNAATVTYAASGELASANAFVRLATAGPTLHAAIDEIPPWMQVQSSQDLVSFDARTAPDAAPGSADIGAISVSYGSDGAFLAGTPSGDHAALLQTASVTRASLLYTGLERLVVSSVGDALHIELENSEARVFQVAADTPTAILTGLIDAVPARITFDHAGSLSQYRATSPISRIQVDFDLRDGQFVNVDIVGVPQSIDLTFEPSSNNVLWVADAPLTSIAVTAALLQNERLWDLVLQITGVPAQFEVVFSSTTTRFRGISAPLGSVFATLSNHGTVTTFAGNHASGVYRSGTGALDASFRMTAINLVEFVKGSNTFTADLRMGGGNAFYLNGDVVSGSTAALAQVTLSALPTSIQFSQNGDAFSYTANANFDLNAYTEIGNVGGIAASPATPVVRGLSMRDGYGCTSGGIVNVCGTGIKASLYLQGFPTGLSADGTSRTVTVTNFQPPRDALICLPIGICFTIDRDSLTLDVDLDDVTASRVRVLAKQDGIPSPITMTFGPLTTSTLANGDKRTTMAYTATAAMGSFTADVIMGTNQGRLEISNIPSSMSVQYVAGKTTSSVTIGNSASISRIYAAAKASVSAATFNAGVLLTEVPATVSLSFGRITYTPSASESYTMPGLTYSASASTLDITAWVDAAMFGGDLTARVTLGVTNLGASTTMGWSAGEAVLTSTPATSLLEIHVWGQYKILKTFSGCWPSCGNWLRVEWGKHAGVVPLTINDLKLKATSFSSIRVKPGITTGIKGTYGGLEFGWTNINAQLDIEVFLKAVADFGWLGCICENVITYNNHDLITVNIKFHLGTDHMSTNAPLLHISSPIPCSWTTAYDLHVEVNPHPHFSQYNGFAISSASAEGEGWLVTPNPWGILPDKAVWVIAGLTSPYGGGFSLTAPCH